MTQLSIREVVRGVKALDKLLAGEGEVIITRRGRPVARLLPMPAARGS